MESKNTVKTVLTKENFDKCYNDFRKKFIDSGLDTLFEQNSRTRSLVIIHYDNGQTCNEIGEIIGDRGCVIEKRDGIVIALIQFSFGLAEK